MKNSTKKSFAAYALLSLTSLAGAFCVMFIPLKITSLINADALKIVFAIELFAMAAATAAICIYETAAIKRRKKEAAFKRRHNERVEKSESFFCGIEIEEIKANRLIDAINAA